MRVHWSRTEPNRFARSLFAGVPTRYDRLAAVLSLGQDRRWRRAMVDRVIDGPARVLDVATGPAGVALQLAERTGAHVLGVDLSEPMLRRGQANVRTAGRQEQITLVLARAEELPFADSEFDALTFTYLLRYVSGPAAPWPASSSRCRRAGSGGQRGGCTPAWSSRARARCSEAAPGTTSAGSWDRASRHTIAPTRSSGWSRRGRGQASSRWGFGA